MVHGCRQLVSWDVRLSPATSATLILSYYHLVEHSKETARVIGRKVGTKSNHHASYEWGYTRATMDGTKRSEVVTWSKPQKTVLSSDWSLQLDFMKSESLSNRRSATLRWIRSRVLYTPPVKPWELVMPEVGL